MNPNELINDLLNFVPSVGAHEEGSQELCAMEYVAFLAGEKHSDHPQCACPVISTYVRVMNDCMTEEWRYQLRGYLLRLIGNRDPKSEAERANFLVSQVGHVYAPILFRSLKSTAFAVLAARLEQSQTLQEQAVIYSRAAQLAWAVPDYARFEVGRFIWKAGELAHNRVRKSPTNKETTPKFVPKAVPELFCKKIWDWITSEETPSPVKTGNHKTVERFSDVSAASYAVHLSVLALDIAQSRRDWRITIDTLDGVLAIGKQAGEVPRDLEDRIHAINELVSA